MRQEDCLLFYILNIFWKDSRWAHNHFWSRIWIIIVLITTFFWQTAWIESTTFELDIRGKPKESSTYWKQSKKSQKIISGNRLHKGYSPIVKNIKYSDTKVFFLFFQGSHWQIPSKYTKNSLGCFMGLQENN